MAAGLAFAMLAAAVVTDLHAEESGAPASGATTRDSAGDDRAAHERAVKLARSGDTASALAILQALAKKHPDDLGVIRDEMVVFGWAGRPSDVVRIFERLPHDEPDYVLASAARAYRDLKRFPDALKLYQEGVRRFPTNADFAAGEILVLTDMGETKAAFDKADAASARTSSVPMLLAAIYAANSLGRPVDALRFADQALAIEPRNREAKREQILAIERMGAPHVALELARESPDAVTPSDVRRLEGSDAAELVRFGSLEPPSEAERFAATDKAIARLDELIERFSKEGETARQDLLRARFDRMVAYRDRVRMTDVVKEYENLSASGVHIPSYALEATADAYIYLREPEMALELYQRVLESEPTSFSAALGRFYALVDLERLDEARDFIRKVDEEQPKWRWLKGDPGPLPNDPRQAADEALANADLYANDLEGAETKARALVDAAPANPSFRIILADVYAARGWPRRAAEEYEIAAALAPQDPAVEIPQGSNALALHAFEQAGSAESDAITRFPERRDAQRLAEEWEIHNRPEIDIAVNKTYESATTVNGGNGVAVDGRIFSAPFDYDWRAFAGEYIASQLVPEGHITDFRHAAGIEWRSGDFVASAEGNLNDYGRDKFGGVLRGTWDIDDEWQLDGNGQLFSKDTPLRALKNKVTADSGSGSVTWRESESRSASLTAEGMNFSDGNLRGSLDGKFVQRLWAGPHVNLDGIVELAGSQNSLTDVPYYSPRHDFLGAAGIDATQIIERRYEFVWSHELVVKPGAYWEQGHGTTFAGSLTYQHKIKTGDDFEVSAGFQLGRQAYDSEFTNSLALILNLTWRPEQ
ncbi:MAG TPA: poly-beta-1,6 N-acetyl-D-glucosamine export porin PgaA [Alphaproteobacteria bacterium]|nr:poly-beta-1,6 N-acetyl-D-glucosamine export porin PgaA [Alphaproteobacteria bacterium]